VLGMGLLGRSRVPFQRGCGQVLVASAGRYTRTALCFFVVALEESVKLACSCYQFHLASSSASWSYKW